MRRGYIRSVTGIHDRAGDRREVGVGTAGIARPAEAEVKRKFGPYFPGVRDVGEGAPVTLSAGWSTEAGEFREVALAIAQNHFEGPVIEGIAGIGSQLGTAGDGDARRKAEEASETATQDAVEARAEADVVCPLIQLPS